MRNPYGLKSPKDPENVLKGESKLQDQGPYLDYTSLPATLDDLASDCRLVVPGMMGQTTNFGWIVYTTSDWVTHFYACPPTEEEGGAVACTDETCACYADTLSWYRPIPSS
jgi:hypothetical protein